RGVVAADGYDGFEALQLADDDQEHRLVGEQEGLGLKRLIRMLPDDQTEVLIMGHFCDMSFKEIADVTGVSISTALGRMRYALANLRKMLEEHNIAFQLG